MPKRMSEDDLQVIEAMRKSGATPKQIAEQIGFSEGAVKKRIYGRGTPKASSLDAGGVTPTPQPPSPTDPTPAPQPPDPDPVPLGGGDDLFPDPVRDFAQEVANVCADIGVKDKMVRLIYKSVYRSPMYHERNGLFTFLNALSGVGAERANIICDQVFSSWYSRQQQQYGAQQPHNPQYPAGSPLVPQRHPGPQYPGHPQPYPVPGFPPPPGYPPVPYPPPYYPPAAPPQRDSDMMTKEEFNRALDQKVAEIRQRDEVEGRFDMVAGRLMEFEKTLSSFKDDMGSGPQYVYEPALDGQGKPVVDERTGEVVMRRVPFTGVNPQASMEAQMVTVLQNALNTIAGMKDQPVNPGMSQNERDLLREQNKNQVLQLQNTVNTQLVALQAENKRLLDRVETQTQGGLSEDGHIMVEEIRQRGDHIGEGIKMANNLLGNMTNIFERAMGVQDHPPGYDAVQQWTPAELAAKRRGVQTYLED